MSGFHPHLLSTQHLCIYSSCFYYMHVINIYVALAPPLSPFLPLFLPPLSIDPSIYYVPVIRSADNSSPASLGSPCIRDDIPSSFQTQEDQLSNPGITTSPLVSQALAGPLSPAKVIFGFYKSLFLKRFLRQMHC